MQTQDYCMACLQTETEGYYQLCRVYSMLHPVSNGYMQVPLCHAYLNHRYSSYLCLVLVCHCKQSDNIVHSHPLTDQPLTLTLKVSFTIGVCQVQYTWNEAIKYYCLNTLIKRYLWRCHIMLITDKRMYLASQISLSFCTMGRVRGWEMVIRSEEWVFIQVAFIFNVQLTKTSLVEVLFPPSIRLLLIQECDYTSVYLGKIECFFAHWK